MSEEPMSQTTPRPARSSRLLVGASALAVVVLVALGLGAFLTGDRGAEGPPDQPRGEPVPDLELTDFDGEPVALADFAGGPLVVNFFASWCPPCVSEMRDALGPVHSELGDEVTFLGVAMQDTPEAALAVVEETGVTYELANDPDGTLFAALGLGGMPATVYVDETGRVVGQHVGALTREQLRDQIDERLSQ